MTAPLFEAEDIHAGYGKLRVLDGVDVTVDAGESVALLGTNGAGKSTFLRVVTGVQSLSAGRVLLDGEDVTDAGPQDLLRRGIVHIPGGHCTFPELTVDESLRIAMWTFRRDAGRVEAARDRVFERFPILSERRSQAAGSLSGGEQQMLALARALVLEPRLLVIDELSLGLAPAVIEGLIEVVTDLHAEGIALLVVEQRLATAARFTERAYFLERGKVQFEGPTSELSSRDDLVRAVFLSGADR
ncbi:ABC transporter ATP-binding protein [Actinospongicola halichondriae]|uniref:ABC transporter ATP-binding protein n=1 Tax=Actinospongicola halichondriae TaxID=3236844 RepID=UPI003D5AD007